MVTTTQCRRLGLAACMLIVWFLAPVAHAASGPQSFPNARIADVAALYIGQSRPTGWNQPGECVNWVRAWVSEAGGSLPSGLGPIGMYHSSGAIEIPLDQAQRGDIFQRSQGNTWSGSPHTGVFAGSTR